MHRDGNHSVLPPRMEPGFWHLETFLFLSDVDEGCAPPRIVPLSRSDVPYAELYDHEIVASGQRGTVLAYRSDVWHRGSDFTRPDASRAVLVAGFPGLGDRPAYQLTRGSVSNERLDIGGSRLLQHTAATDPGGSGGPVLDPGGRVVGVSSGKAREREAAERELARGLPVGEVEVAVLVETALGVQHMAAIACASPRIVSISLGSEDFTRDIGVEPSADGEEQEYAALLDRAGFRMTRVVATISTSSLIEARPGRRP